MKREIALVTFIGNLLMLFAWGGYRPVARYDMEAGGVWRRAMNYYREGEPTRAYLLYQHLADDYPFSRYAEKGEFHAARTAYRKLGRFDLAREGFTRVLERDSTDTSHVESSRSYLSYIEAGSWLPEETQWEFAQALVEMQDGNAVSASTRFNRIIAKYPGSPLAEISRKIMADPS